MISSETQQELHTRFYPELEETVFGAFERRLQDCLGHDAVVLDAGSGPGTWVLQEQRDRIRLLVGEDVYQPEDTSNLDRFVLASCDQLPFDDGTFDVVFSYLVIEHLPDPEGAFAEIRRVLKPGGYFCFKTPAVHTPLFLLAKVLPTALHKRLKSQIGTDEDDVFPTYYRANSVRLLDRQLKAVGMTPRWVHTMDQTYAYMTHNKWTYALGLMFSRCTQSRWLAFLRNQIIGIYQRPEEMV